MFNRSKSQLKKEIAELLANDGTKWHFIPPAAPNFGGLWEAGVKSVKFHLKRVIGNSTLTFEEMYTLLTQIEACVNSRPMSPLTDNPDDMTPLTPGHFLVGEPLITVPEEDVTDIQINRLNRWQLIQRITQHFWRRWHEEFLTQLQQRPKWTKKEEELQIGDLVLIKDDRLPPGKWLLGRIEEKHPGADNVTRVVTLRCKNTTMKMPITKLCALPMTRTFAIEDAA